MAIQELSVSHFLPIRQSNNSNIKGLSLLQTLAISENFDSQYTILGLRQTFNLAQSIKLNRTINLTVNQSIPFYQHDSKIAGQETVLQTFYAWQKILKTPTGDLTQLFKINQTVVGIDTKGVIQTLALTQQVIGNHVGHLTVTQTINFTQGILGTKSEDCQSLINFTLDGPNSSGGNVF